MSLTSANAAEFFMTGLGFVDAMLTNGWALKYGGVMYDGTVIEKGLADLTYEELEGYMDPRIEVVT